MHHGEISEEAESFGETSNIPSRPWEGKTPFFLTLLGHGSVHKKPSGEKRRKPCVSAGNIAVKDFQNTGSVSQHCPCGALQRARRRAEGNAYAGC